MSQRLPALLLICLMLVVPTVLVLSTADNGLLDVMFLFPGVVSALWIAGGLAFWLRRERSEPCPRSTPASPEHTPLVSILVLCREDTDDDAEALAFALAQHYPEIEVIAVVRERNALREATPRSAPLPQDARLRVVHLIGNTPPAMALHMGALAARGDYLVCVDGDARLAPEAVTHLMAPLLTSPRVGAVTGSTCIRRRASLTGWIQAGECAAITGMAQRTQRLSAHLGPLAGVTAFRRAALDSVGYWQTASVSPDIDMSWRLRRARWAIVHQPRALCWRSVPASVCTLQKLRVARAMGHADALLTHSGDLGRWSQRHMWMPLASLTLWLGWACTVALATGLWLLGYLVPLPTWAHIHTLLPSPDVLVGITSASVLLALVGMFITHRYEPTLWRRLVWMIWYPLLFWPLSLIATWISLPGALLRQRHRV